MADGLSPTRYRSTARRRSSSWLLCMPSSAQKRRKAYGTTHTQ